MSDVTSIVGAGGTMSKLTTAHNDNNKNESDSKNDTDIAETNYPVVQLDRDTFRLVPSHFPPIALFENLLDPEELDAAYALESLTNDRLRDQVGEIALVSPEDRITGEGTTPIMAAFTHAGVESRFTNGQYGVYYAGLTLETAIAESAFSRARFLKATSEGPQTLTMRCYRCKVDTQLVDVRSDEQAHHPVDFSYAQQLGAKLKQQNQMGVLYRSVRHKGGECIAAFKPKAMIPPVMQMAHYQYQWDGDKMVSISKMESVDIDIGW